MKKASIIKRISAVVIDMLFISLIASLVISLPIFGHKTDKFNEELVDITQRYINGEVTREDYNSQSLEISYNLEKASLVTSLTNIIIVMAYFVCFDYFLEGKTIGKKLMKLKLKSVNNQKNNIIRYILRELIVSLSYIEIVNLLLVNVLSKNAYLTSYSIVSNLLIVFYIFCLVVAMMREDGRGIHDFIGNTIVVSTNDDINVEETIVNNVDVKKENQKRKKNKKEEK